jgi:hypothetical protein
LTVKTTDERHRPATRPASRRSLTVIDDVNLDALPKTQFAALVFEREFPHITQSQWDTSSCSLDAVLEYALSTSRTTRAQTALLDLEPLFGPRSLALFDLQGGSAHCRVAGAERTTITEIERWLRDLFPVPQITESREVPVRFWSYGPRGAKAVSRTIAVPELDEVRGNYPLAARERLGRLLGPDFRPAEGGQLILWHGAPGTGKTYALRALGWEWRNWCELHYVIDPEVFFGQRADYMLDVVLGEDSKFHFDDDEEAERERKWRLLILEDTGELLAADAKERTGQGLSRLLNLVDGIIGQGLRVLVLVTTNEPLRRLHPAVARPGRCAARVEFEPFPAAEAVAWLAEHGVEDQDAASAPLANLFARVEGYETGSEKPVGFGR